MDTAVYVRLCGKVYDIGGLVCFECFVNEPLVGDIAPHEYIPFFIFQVSKILKVSRISEFVKINDSGCGGFSCNFADEIRTDKAGSTEY